MRKPTNPVNQPQSGTYGDKAATQRMADALPDPTPTPEPPSINPQGVTNVRSNRDAPSMPGVPAPLMAPSNRPGVPVDTPLGAGPGAGAVGVAKVLLAMRHGWQGFTASRSEQPLASQGGGR